MHSTTNEPVLTSSDRLWFATVLAAFFILILLIGCSSCAARQYPGDVPTMSDPAVAKLIKVVDGKKASMCTVFKIAEGYALTAGHCCAAPEDPEKDINEILGIPFVAPPVLFHATGPHAVPGAAFTVLVLDKDHDICVMRGELYGAPLILAPHDPPIGARVWTAGYPNGSFLISDGHWSGRDSDAEGTASVAVYGGASGSPVMDNQMRVIGILRAYLPPMVNSGIIAPIEWVRANMVARVR